MRASSVTGSGAREASACSAGSSPRSDSTAGWMPRASSRSSSRLVASSSCARSSSSASFGSSPARERAERSSSASATSRDCAPSCRSRSSLRRAASPASTIRAREACSSSTRTEMRRRSSPPRNAKGVSQAEMNAAHHAASPAPERAIVTSRNVNSALRYTGVSWSRSNGPAARQYRTVRTTTTRNNEPYRSAAERHPEPRQVVVGPDQQQALRAVRAVELLRAREQEPGSERQREDHVAGADDPPVERGLDPPVREADAEVQEEAAPQASDRDPQRVQEARVRRLERGHEPREAEQHHQHPGAVARLPAPRVQPGADEPPADRRTEDRERRLRLLVVAGEHDHAHRHPRRDSRGRHRAHPRGGHVRTATDAIASTARS